MQTPQLAQGLFVLATIYLSGCATPPQQATQSADSLEQALAREATLDNTYTVSADDGFFTAQVSASARPKVTVHDGVYQVSVPIASSSPAECFIYQETLDSAVTLNELLDEPLSDMQKTQILRLDAGTFGELPYLHLERLYMTEQQAAGVLKGIVVPFESSLLACLHDSAGYSETFVKMAGSFANTMALRDEPEESLVHKEILLWRVQDMNIGYTLNWAAPDAEGDIKNVVETAVLLPRSADEIMAHDEYNLTYEQPNGDMINGLYAEAENGELIVWISLEPVEGGGYQVEGTFQDKEIDAPLQTSSRVVGPYFQHREMIQAANPAQGQPRALRLDSYVPSVNPLQTISFDVQPTGTLVGGLPEYELVFAGLKATGVVDDKGQTALLFKMGSQNIELSRAYVYSKP